MFQLHPQWSIHIYTLGRHAADGPTPDVSSSLTVLCVSDVLKDAVKKPECKHGSAPHTPRRGGMLHGWTPPMAHRRASTRCAAAAQHRWSLKLCLALQPAQLLNNMMCRSTMHLTLSTQAPYLWKETIHPHPRCTMCFVLGSDAAHDGKSDVKFVKTFFFIVYNHEDSDDKHWASSCAAL